MDLNASISIVYTKEIKGLLTKFKDVFAWSYKELKGLPKKIVKVK